MHIRKGWAGLCLSGIGLLTAACHGRAPMPATVPTAQQLLADIAAHQRQARTLKAQAKVEFWDNLQGDRLKATLLMWATRDGRLRLDVDSQLGTLSSLAVSGGTFQLLDVRNDRYFTGEAAPCTLERVIHIAIHPPVIAAALLST